MPELAKDALEAQGFVVIGGYMSPANDAFKKKVCILSHHLFAYVEVGKTKEIYPNNGTIIIKQCFYY